MNYRLCLFDFDGTIADTLEEARCILNGLSEEYGFLPVQQEELPEVRQLSAKQLLKHLGIKKRWVPRLLAKGAADLKSRVKDLPLIEGMEEAVRKICQASELSGILTSNTVENVELFLAEHNLDNQFEFISSVSKLSGKHKHLRSILRTFSLANEEVIYVGDELRDIKAAKKAKIPVMAVTWGFNSREVLEEAQPDFIVDSVEEMLDVLGVDKGE